MAAAGAGLVLVLLVVFFYVPIFLTEMHTPLALEGMNYVGDTLLFGATVLLAGFGAEARRAEERRPEFGPYYGRDLGCGASASLRGCGSSKTSTDRYSEASR